MAANVLGRFLNRLTSQIEKAEGLDRPSEPLSRFAQQLTGRRWVTDLLSGTPLGHPLHPLLVTVPIGSWTGAMVLDLLQHKDSARTLVGLGALSAVPTAVSGLNDWRSTSGAEQRVGVLHAGLNTLALGFYTASWLARRRGHHGLGVALTLPGMAVLGTSGWLGGHLSYALGVGVDTTAFQSGSENWVDALGADDVVQGRLNVADAGGVPVLVTRTLDGTIVAYANRCTHRGGPLHEGEVVDGCVRCPLHGSEFSLRDGSVIHGPATRPQPAYEVRVHGDRVEVRRSPEPRALRTRPAGN